MNPRFYRVRLLSLPLSITGRMRVGSTTIAVSMACFSANDMVVLSEASIIAAGTIIKPTIISPDHHELHGQQPSGGRTSGREETGLGMVPSFEQG